MDFPILTTSSRRSRRALRRRKIRRAALWAVSSLLVVWSFAAGVLWHRLKSKPAVSETAPLLVTNAQRAEGLRLLDLAVEAEHAGRFKEAAELAVSSREADPTSPAADVLLGEMAFEQGQFEAVGPAARAALERSGRSGSAKLLLGLLAWVLRGQSGGTDTVNAALRLLDEAAVDEPSNVAVLFFAAEILQASGRVGDSYSRLMASLHRQHPWHSAALLSAKLGVTRVESGLPLLDVGKQGIAPDTDVFGSAAMNLQTALRKSIDPTSAINGLRSVFTQPQVFVLSEDPAFSLVAVDLARRATAPARPSGSDRLPNRAKEGKQLRLQ